MGYLFNGLQLIASIVSLICFIMVVIAMFKSGDTTMGVICLALILCFGLGGLVAFVLGWINSAKWNVQQIMMVWTVAIVAGFLFGGLAFATGGGLQPAGNLIQP